MKEFSEQSRWILKSLPFLTVKPSSRYHNNRYHLERIRSPDCTHILICPWHTFYSQRDSRSPRVEVLGIRVAVDQDVLIMGSELLQRKCTELRQSTTRVFACLTSMERTKWKTSKQSLILWSGYRDSIPVSNDYFQNDYFQNCSDVFRS